MKAGMHPRYKPVTITCVGCGSKIETRSTKGKDFSIDVCSHCHPFYTGRQKFVDSAGRVERFQKKWAAVDKKAPKAEKKTETKAEEAAETKEAVAEKK
jgi:large subunit ribosomal protein L31